MAASMQALEKEKWSLDHAAHLLRRAGFGGTPDEVQKCYNVGLHASVKSLTKGWMPGGRGEPKLNLKRLAPEKLLPLPTLPHQSSTRRVRESETQLRMQRDQQILFTLQYEWLQRMYSQQAPLEKLVFFWHGMLTSAYGKVTIASFMVRQNQLFREFAFGDYRELIKRVVLDPAMIIYLDIDQNKRSKPNENFARELLEMFTLGEGNYAPELIKKTAKEMVGYWVKKPQNRIPIVHEDLKGMEANSGYSDKRRRLSRLVDSIFGLPVCGELLCRRLWKFYVRSDEPSPGILRHLVAVLRKSRWNVATVLQEIFLSREFYAPEVLGHQIKQPLQHLIQSHKEVGAVLLDLKTSYYAMQKLGQSVFNPPNVSGWPVGEDWINGTTLSARYELSSMVVNLIDRQKLTTADYFFRKLQQNKLSAVEELVNYFLATPLPVKKMKIMLLVAERVQSREQMLTLMEYLMCTPEYQLC